MKDLLVGDSRKSSLKLEKISVRFILVHAGIFSKKGITVHFTDEQAHL